jgi:hypothetical protein
MGHMKVIYIYIYEHMKAHENNKIAMSQIQKLEKEILSNNGV